MSFESRLVLVIDSRTGEQSLQRLDRSLEGVDRRGEQASRQMGGLGREMQVLRRVAAPLTAVLGSMFTARALKGQIDFANQLADVRTRIGASAEALSEYNYVARMANVQLGTLTTAWQRQTRRVAEAAQGTGAAKDALEALNLSAQELNRMAPEAAFERITEAMQGVENQADRTALAMKLWDTEGVALLQIVNQGTDAIQRQREEAERLGLTISQDTAEAMAGFNNEMERLKFMAMGASQSLLSELVPSLTSTLESTAELVDSLGGAERVMNTAVTVGGALAALYAGRLAGSIGEVTARKYRNIEATIAGARAEVAATQQALRRTAAELNAARQLRARAMQEAKVTAGTNAHAFALDNLARASARLTQAQTAHTASTHAQTAAMQRASVAANGLRGAMSMLGGPVGIATTAALAFWMFRDSADDVAVSLDELERPLDSIIERFQQLTRDQQQASLVSWGARMEEEVELSERAWQRLRRQVMDETFFKLPRADRAEFVDSLHEAFDEVKEGAQTFDDVLQDVLSRVDVDDADIASWRLLAGEMSEHSQNAQRASGVIDDLRSTMDDAADSAKDLGNDLRDNKPSDETIKAWSELNDKLAEHMAILRDPSEMGAVVRELDSIDGLPAWMRGYTIFQQAQIDAEKARQEAVKERQEAEKRAAADAQQSAQQILRSYESQVASLNQQISLYGETSELAKTRYELEHGSLRELLPEQKEHIEQLAEELELKQLQVKEEEKLSRLRNRLQPARAAQQQMARDMNTLTLAYASGRIALEDYLQLVWQLQEAHIEASQEVEKAASYSFTTWEEVALNTVRRVDNAGQDLWLGFIDGSRNALDTVKRFFQQTLAEIAHMLTTQRLTVAVAGSLGMGGSGAAMAGEGGGFGGMSSMLSTGRNVWNAAQQGFGNIAWTGVPTSYTGGWAGSATAGMGTTGGSSFLGGSTANFSGMQGLAGAGAGFVGGWAGNQVFGSSEYGGVLSAIGTAVGTYFGGPIGAAIGSFIGSGLGSLFGGSKTSPSLRLATTASNDRGFFEEGKTSSSPFGYVGFADHGTQRLNRIFDGKQQEFLDSVAEMDNLLASLARSEDELASMATAVQGVTLNAKGAEGIVNQLGKRTVAAVGAIDGEFGKFVASLDGGVEEIVATALIAREALTLLSSSQERLGIRFNEAAKGAYESAFAIAELAGGLDNLAAMQEAYYQAYFSEAERAAHLQEDLTKALAELGMQLPDTRDGFRQLVEAQNLNTEAGREAYVALLSLAGGFDQLQQVLGETEHTADRLRDAWESFQRDSLRMQQELLSLAGDSAGAIALAREQELAAMDESLRPFQERIWALQDEAEALNNYHRELERVGNQLGSALNQIQGFVDQRRGAMGTPAQNLEELERQWLEQLSLAQSGDLSALRSITQYADRLMQAGQEYFASGEGFQDIQEQVLSALEGLDNLTAEEFLADEIRDAIEGLDVDKIAQTALDELAALQSLHDTTQSQVSLLVDINQSVISVRDALEGMGAVPSFASGGYHSGGLRLVGERGPELEVTGPSRIFDAATTRSMLSPAPLLGGSDVTELLQDLKRELVVTREENRRLLERVGDNTSATVGAVMQGNETSARQRSEQIREQRAANRAARITRGGRVT